MLLPQRRGRLVVIQTIAMTCAMQGGRFAEGVTLPWLNRWSLSACQARAVFPSGEYRLVLNTDDAGRELLIGKLALPFDEVTTTDLSQLPPDLGWLWSLPKVSTYRMLALAGRPFLHLDYDFKFWRKPEKIMQADAFAQHVTPCPARQQQLATALKHRAGGLAGDIRLTCNGGIFGGNAVALIAEATTHAVAVAVHPGNRAAFQSAAAVSDWLPCSLIEETAAANFIGSRMVPLLPAEAGCAQWDAAGCAHEAGNKNEFGIIAHAEFRLFTEHPAQWRRTRDAWLSLS